MDDPIIEQLEADIQQSRFSKWDVETFLAKRHQAKIEALEKVKGKRGLTWQAVKEAAVGVLAVIGFFALHITLGVWLVSGLQLQ